MALLKHLVYSDQRLEGLNLVRHDRLDLHSGEEGQGRLVVPGVDDTASDMLTLGRSLFDARSLADVDSEVVFRLGHVDIAASAACEAWIMGHGRGGLGVIVVVAVVVNVTASEAVVERTGFRGGLPPSHGLVGGLSEGRQGERLEDGVRLHFLRDV